MIRRPHSRQHYLMVANAMALCLGVMFDSAVLAIAAAEMPVENASHSLARNLPRASAADTIQLSGKTMGPIDYHVVIAQPPIELNETDARRAVQSTLDRINDRMSTYKPESSISRFNNSDSTDWFDVDSETASVVSRSLEISRLTNGAFDVTVAPAVNLWRFGPEKTATFELPSSQQIEELKHQIGYQKLSVRPDPPAIKKTDPAVSIDLSAIAKGYAVDQVAATLHELGCENYMVEVGGEVFARGERAGGGSWRIGIEKPQEFGREISEVAELSNRAMATSGDYRNFEVFKGKRYSHTIDPATCCPVEHSLASACVVASDCMTADAIATAVMVMGSPRGMELRQSVDFELLTFAREENFGDDFSLEHSKSFPIAKQADFPPENSTTLTPTSAQDSSVASDSTRPSDPTSIWPAFIGAVVVISLAILGMAIGAIFGNKPVRGSCGGLANLTSENGEANCGICAKPTMECPDVPKTVN